MLLADHKQLASELTAELVSRGAHTAEVSINYRTEKEIGIRDQKIETLQQSNAKGLLLTISRDHRRATVSTCDFSRKSLVQLMGDVLHLAEFTGADEFYSLPDLEELGKVEEDLKLYDPEEEDIPIALRIQIAQELERKTLQYDPSLIPDGVSLSSHSGHRVLANSAGYCEGYLFSASSMSSSCAVPDDQVGWNTSRKQSSYWYDANIQFHRLASIDSIARTAADRTLRKRGAQKPKTQKAPVIFENMVARTFLSYVAAGVTGHNLYTKQSYLLDKLNQKVAGGNITLVDDPLLPGCLGSKPFDAEGVRARKKYVIEKGVLKNYLLDSYSARKLGLKTSGNAGSFGNLSLLAGPYSLEQLIASIDNGVLITSFSGFGALIRNGDFSQGAQGFWILNGKIAFPVNEFTITSTFDEILHNIEMIGNDPLTNGTILAPSFKVREMTISGT